MHRALSLAVLLVVPAVELSAQRGVRRADTDTSEKSVAEAIATAGVIGLSMLRMLGQQELGDVSYRRFCYAACGSVSPSAALQLSAGPASLKFFDKINPAALDHAPLAKPADVASQPTSTESVVNEIVAPAAAVLNDDFIADMPAPAKANGLSKLAAKNTSNTTTSKWNGGQDLGCALGGCSPYLPLPNTPPFAGDDPVNLNDLPLAPQLNSPDLTLEEVPVIVNPEPGTWALVAAGIGGLALVRRRRR